ncbi:MAG TPA: haloacid dehalogenase-like hydrolase [Povalibacter sp.]|uniref:HAD family hydrolase n=1 Tax=Povalibacter sp. TaxID=1962978 RepID=UPI002CF84C9E|nr:haloacid dehalogenase-like hydrolase [Povalibacter sp.]HMN44530.1 haloacid dehalogenase-like hydrolase [Povalibacter sp.]
MTQPRALVVFDLDGTLLRGPTVCEVLAQYVGRLPRMQEFERLKQRNGIAAAREEMAAWYRDVPRPALLQSLSQAQHAPGLAEGISLLKAHGVVIGIASITWHFAATYFADALGIEHCLATGLHDSGAIDHVWPEHKAAWVLDLAARLKVPLERTAAVGDSAGDYDMLSVVSTPVFVGAEPPPQAGWRHMPAANIEHIARHCIGLWSLQPNTALQRDA